jgi:prephenate dehydrogenase
MIYGTGLIGGSVGMALTRRGWQVSGIDVVPSVAKRAVALGAIAEVGEDHSAELVVVATPVHVAPEVVGRVLSGPYGPDAVVTDVGSVKGPLVGSIDHPFFVGGHPMAGSEQVGIEGAAADLFVGATWVLTPTASTDPDAYARLRAVLADIGADVVALDPDRHDSLVAVVSHVPHLTAATLMTLAADLEDERAAVLKLAAGGFRDMTRIAAGQPSIWPGICDDNAEAIVETLDRLIEALTGMRRRVADRDHRALLEVLGRAASARRALSERAPRTDGQAEVRIPVSDRVGVLAEITTLATELGVSIDDVEIAHSVEGDRGVLVLVVEARSAPTLVEAVTDRGYRAAITPLGTAG